MVLSKLDIKILLAKALLLKSNKLPMVFINGLINHYKPTIDLLVDINSEISAEEILQDIYILHMIEIPLGD